MKATVLMGKRAPYLTLAVIIPTLRRPNDLSRLLESMNSQLRKPEEIIIACMEDDSVSHDVVKGWAADCPLGSVHKVAKVYRKGHLPPLLSALEICQSDIFCQIDDDAIPQADWLLKIEDNFKDCKTGGVGGRVVNHTTRYGIMTGEETQILTPGKLSWYGRSDAITWGENKPRNSIEVDYLLGGNMAFRKEALLGCIDINLNGGSSTLYELDVCLSLRKKGYRLVYCPDIVVDHYPAQRYIGIERGRNSKECFWYAYNLTYVCLKHLKPRGKLVFFLYFFIGGQWASPSFMTYILSLLKGRGISLRKELAPSLKGRISAVISYYSNDVAVRKRIEN